MKSIKNSLLVVQFLFNLRPSFPSKKINKSCLDLKAPGSYKDRSNDLPTPHLASGCLITACKAQRHFKTRGSEPE